MRAAEVSAGSARPGPARSAAPARRPGGGRPPQASLPARLARSTPGGGSGAGGAGGSEWRRPRPAKRVAEPLARPGPAGPASLPPPGRLRLEPSAPGRLRDRLEGRHGLRPSAVPCSSALSCRGRPAGLTPAPQLTRALQGQLASKGAAVGLGGKSSVARRGWGEPQVHLRYNKAVLTKLWEGSYQF